MIVVDFLFTNDLARSSLALLLIHSRNDAAILKSSKRQRFDTGKRNKKLNAGEKRFVTALPRLTIMMYQLVVL